MVHITFTNCYYYTANTAAAAAVANSQSFLFRYGGAEAGDRTMVRLPLVMMLVCVFVCVHTHVCMHVTDQGNTVSPSQRKASCERVAPPSPMSKDCPTLVDCLQIFAWTVLTAARVSL